MEVSREDRIDVGYRVGRLTVRERIDVRRNGCMVWRCTCDCGEEILLDARLLQRGIVSDCGCSGKCLAPAQPHTGGRKESCGRMRGPQSEQYYGKRFGALTVTGYAGKADGKHMWRCRCDCGRETEVAQSNLKSGHTRSCGCRQREACRENLKLVDGTSVVMIEHRMKRPIRSNTSGVSGVYRDQRRGMWCAQITFKGKTYYLGSFKELEEAVEARRKGEEMYDDFLEWYYNRNLEEAPTKV